MIAHEAPLFLHPTSQHPFLRTYQLVTRSTHSQTSGADALIRNEGIGSLER